MQKQIRPLEEKLARDGKVPYNTRTAMLEIKEKIASLKGKDLAEDLMPLFESPVFVQAWIEAFHANFEGLVENYLG